MKDELSPKDAKRNLSFCFLFSPLLTRDRISTIKRPAVVMSLVMKMQEQVIVLQKWISRAWKLPVIPVRNESLARVEPWANHILL